MLGLDVLIHITHETVLRRERGGAQKKVCIWRNTHILELQWKPSAFSRRD